MKHAKRKLVTQASVYGILSSASSFSLMRWQQEQSQRSQNEMSGAMVQTSSASHSSPTKTFLKQAMLAQTNEIETCYDEYLEREPERKSGSLAVLWEIKDDGGVHNPQVMTQTELSDLPLQECVLKKVSEMKFDPEKVATPTRYSYRFHFKAKAPGAIQFE